MQDPKDRRVEENTQTRELFLDENEEGLLTEAMMEIEEEEKEEREAD